MSKIINEPCAAHSEADCSSDADDSFLAILCVWGSKFGCERGGAFGDRSSDGLFAGC